LARTLPRRHARPGIGARVDVGHRLEEPQETVAAKLLFLVGQTFLSAVFFYRFWADKNVCPTSHAPSGGGPSPPSVIRFCQARNEVFSVSSSPGICGLVMNTRHDTADRG